MALRQVGARIEGDVFQGMFFWMQACQLLRPHSMVARVTMENDQAAGVDDVSVEYVSPGIDAGGRKCSADYYQVKYHVDRRGKYSASSFCDPSFTTGKRSLLQRFHDARVRLGDGNGWHRLHLVSNWEWDSDDKLGALLRESEEGALPDCFFCASLRSNLGKIRQLWRSHLILNEADFEDFARRLRIQVNYLNRPALKGWLSDRFALAGLREIPVDKMQNVYDSLTQQLIMNGTNRFDPGTFRAFCEREELLVPWQPLGPLLGIRSIMRFAERIEDECDSFACVARCFEGRHVREPDAWQSEVLPEIRSFLNNPSLRSKEHHLLLECHGSIAFAAGYELDRKSATQVFPVQKGVRKALWKPGMGGGTATSLNSAWTVAEQEIDSNSAGVAVAISVSRSVLADAKSYLKASGKVGYVVDARPALGVGQRVVVDADHAVALADALAEVIRRVHLSHGGTTHLFIAAPNAFAYFLGQHRGALGKLQLYEFDFEGEQGGSYSPSFYLST